MAQTREGAIKVFCKRVGISTEYYYEQIAKGLKWCSGCKCWVSRDYFIKDCTRVDGLSTKCKDCTHVKVRVDRHTIPSNFKGKHHSPESIEKLRIAHIGKPSKRKGIARTVEERIKISDGTRASGKLLYGENNPHWKGGKCSATIKSKASLNYKLWKEAVNARDKYTCQDCGGKDKSIMETHHIKPYATFPEGRFDVENGITLCKYCHQLRHTIDEGKRARIKKERGNYYAQHED